MRAVVVIVLVVVGAFAPGLFACATASAGAPAASYAEVHGPGGVEGYRSVHALFYVVPVDDGVVIVDTGFDESGAALAEAVAGRRVKAVLLTHAHIDHRSGITSLGDVAVYAGADDVEIMRGTRRYRSLAQAFITAVWPAPALPQRLNPVAGGDVIDVGGERFAALSLPGHTPGSTVWLWRNVAFTGDAVAGDIDGGLDTAPALLSDDDDEARRSMSTLWGIDATVLLDGHGGRTDDARAHIERALAHHGAR